MNLIPPPEHIDRVDLLSDAEQRRAQALLDEWSEHGYNGAAPAIAAASAAYWANHDQERLTQARVADVFDVSALSIRSHKDNICPALGARDKWELLDTITTITDTTHDDS